VASCCFKPDHRLRDATTIIAASELKRLSALHDAVIHQADIRREGQRVRKPIVFNTVDIERLEKLPLAADLLAYMPISALQQQLSLTETEMLPSSLPESLKVFMLHGLPTWSAGTLRGTKNTWLRLLGWAASNNFDVSSGTINSRAVLDFLHFVKATAVKKAQAREAARPSTS
jgi:hypothetical protein